MTRSQQAFGAVDCQTDDDCTDRCVCIYDTTVPIRRDLLSFDKAPEDMPHQTRLTKFEASWCTEPPWAPIINTFQCQGGVSEVAKNVAEAGGKEKLGTFDGYEGLDYFC